MGLDEVAYHEATVVGREDDHPGRALDYYGSRGETPLRWGGAGAARLGLQGEVTPDAYDAAFGPGGFQDPVTLAVLAKTSRPGFELVVGAHKSVAILGLAGRAEDMHSILDAETETTMAWLDTWFQQRGGRRGEDRHRVATGGLTYAVTRHATSRAGDPSPHDHVLVANIIEAEGGRRRFMALDSAALRDTTEAATMVGRLHSAWRAAELGYRIEPDDGPSGRLRHWRISSVPDAVCQQFSKRADEIADHLAESGYDSYRAKGIAARITRAVKRHVGPDQLTARWHAELEDIGWPLDRLARTIDRGAPSVSALRFPLTDDQIATVAAEVLDLDGGLMARHKAFTRTQLISELAPRLYGHHPSELDRALAHIERSHELVPLIGTSSQREPAYTTVRVLENEASIAWAIEGLADRHGRRVPAETIEAAIAAKEAAIAGTLTAGQRRLVEQLCSSAGAASLVIGVAGAGKTTALDAATTALESAGFRVLGTSTSGQAARTLGAEASIESRTFASLLWRLEQHQIEVDPQIVVIVDEAGMANDTDLARLALAVQRSHAHLVLVGDHRQLTAIGPGGALAALMERRPDLVITLEDNVRQKDPAERRALADLRDGDVGRAIDWYATNHRIVVGPNRTGALIAMASAWADDHRDGRDAVLLAWRRHDVGDLNRLARDHWRRLGQLVGPDEPMPGGRRYAIGDRVVALAPNHAAGIITSETFLVEATEPDYLRLRSTHDARMVELLDGDTDAEHLDHAYALTVHRSQGATYDRTHVLANGGGRELAYVACSRAKEHTQIHAIADDLDQALDDLRVDWGAEQAQHWLGPDVADAPAVAEPPQPPAPPAKTTWERLTSAQQQLADLRAGTGIWRSRPEGEAARALAQARADVLDVQRRLASGDVGRFQRRAVTTALGTGEAALVRAQGRWAIQGLPAEQSLELLIDRLREEIERASEPVVFPVPPPPAPADLARTVEVEQRGIGLGR